MRIVFMGTPEFAAEALKRLFEDGHEIAAVFTQPDKPKNRGMKLTPSPVKALAEGRVPVYQPVTLRDGEAERILRELSPDVIAVVAYGRILPAEILEIPRLGCINIHASLLPKYRGSAPIQRAILAGDRVTGVTSMYMAPELDAGDMILTKQTEILKYETSGELFARLAPLGAELLAETIAALENGSAPRIPQDESQVSIAPPLLKSEAPVDWTRNAQRVAEHICGMDPWPCATAQFGDTVYKLFSPRVSDRAGAPGEVLDGEGLTIACGKGAVKILELQSPGKKRMRATDYLRGNKLEGSAVLTYAESK